MGEEIEIIKGQQGKRCYWYCLHCTGYVNLKGKPHGSTLHKAVHEQIMEGMGLSTQMSKIDLETR